MGWLFGWANRKALIEHLIEPQEGEERKLETLAHCCKGYTTLWVLHQVTYKPTGERTRFVVCYLLRRYGEWGYKDVDESMGPNEISCPLSYIERATEPASEYSRQWRERVKQYHQRRNQ